MSLFCEQDSSRTQDMDDEPHGELKDLLLALTVSVPR